MSDSPAFDTLALKPELLSTLAELGYQHMTPVQAQSLPRTLNGGDVLARAKTGSGKTAAFALGVLNKLDVQSYRVQALVLCPTRELADQVTKEFRRLARAIPNVKVLTLCGGMPMGAQLDSLKRHAHIVVGTPGRILKHLGKQTLRLDGVQTLVLDEADRMLDMGFTDELDEILAYLPAQRQTLLFSATYPDAIAKISARVQRDPVQVDVTEHEQPAQISQYWCSVNQDNRNREVVRALKAWGGALNLVFCNTKVACAKLAKHLQTQGIASVALHGDLDQAERTEVLVRFSNRSATVLIATDVAARGLDIKDLDAVFNYELPQQSDTYVHRIGRTGRAGKTGVAVSLVADREMPQLLAIETQLPDIELVHCEIPAAQPDSAVLVPAMTTLEINGGRKNKLRPGDLLGALTANDGVPGKAVGAIDLFDTRCYVAVPHDYAKRALSQLGKHKIKGKQFRARIVQG